MERKAQKHMAVCGRRTVYTWSHSLDLTHKDDIMVQIHVIDQGCITQSSSACSYNLDVNYRAKPIKKKREK